MPHLRDCSMCSGPGEVHGCSGLPKVFTFEIQCACCGMRSMPSIESDPEKAAEQLARWWNRMHSWIEAGKIREALTEPAQRL